MATLDSAGSRKSSSMGRSSVASESRLRTRLYFVWLKASSLVKPCAHIGSALLLVLLSRSTAWTCAAYICVAWWSKRDMEVLVSVSETSSEAYRIRVSGLAPRRCSDSASMSELHTWSGDVAYVT
jgi:hypothetical protein